MYKFFISFVIAITVSLPISTSAEFVGVGLSEIDQRAYYTEAEIRTLVPNYTGDYSNLFLSGDTYVTHVVIKGTDSGNFFIVGQVTYPITQIKLLSISDVVDSITVTDDVDNVGLVTFSGVIESTESKIHNLFNMHFLVREEPLYRSAPFQDVPMEVTLTSYNVKKEQIIEEDTVIIEPEEQIIEDASKQDTLLSWDIVNFNAKEIESDVILTWAYDDAAPPGGVAIRRIVPDMNPLYGTLIYEGAMTLASDRSIKRSNVYEYYIYGIDADGVYGNYSSTSISLSSEFKPQVSNAPIPDGWMINNSTNNESEKQSINFIVKNTYLSLSDIQASSTQVQQATSTELLTSSSVMIIDKGLSSEPRYIFQIERGKVLLYSLAFLPCIFLCLFLYKRRKYARILDSKHMPIPLCKILFEESLTRSIAAESQTDKYGRFRIKLKGGRYLVTIEKENWKGLKLSYSYEQYYPEGVVKSDILVK